MGLQVNNSDSDTRDVFKKSEFKMESFDRDPDTVCGVGAFQPRWLQRWATPRTYLILYSILGTLSGAYYTYRIGVISTLEKRFAFKSKTSGMIMMVDEVTPIFLGVPVGHFAARTHRPRMIGLGMFMVAMGCFVSALPYLIYGPETHLNVLKMESESSLELCDPENPKESCESDDRPPTISSVLLLMLAGLLKGFGNIAYHAIGLAYMDDNAKKKNTSLYLAVTFSLRLLGPLLGFLISSACLKYYENPFDNPGYGPEDPRWIGAWWIGFIFQGALLMFFSALIALFPRRLPGHRKPTVNIKKGSGFHFDFKGLLVGLKRLGTNPIYVALVFQSILSIGTVGLYMMLPKYMENQFRLTASDASLYSGPPGIAALMSSFIMGGYLLRRFKPRPKVLATWMFSLELIGCLGYPLFMIPRCDSVQMANFGLQERNLMLDGDCNANCNCSRRSFTPVCGSNQERVFFSPCHAGCIQSMNKTFSNCSCTWDSTAQQKLEPLTEGFCVNEKCWWQTLMYTISLPIFQFIINLLKVAVTMVLFRAIRPSDKSIAIGLLETFLCLLGFIPFLAAFGSLVDSACLVWEESCGETGNCWFYDIDKFNYMLHGTASVSSLLSALCMLVIYFNSDRLQNFYEEGVQDEEVMPQPEENAADRKSVV